MRSKAETTQARRNQGTASSCSLCPSIFSARLWGSPPCGQPSSSSSRFFLQGCPAFHSIILLRPGGFYSGWPLVAFGRLVGKRPSLINTSQPQKKTASLETPKNTSFFCATKARPGMDLSWVELRIKKNSLELFGPPAFLVVCNLTHGFISLLKIKWGIYMLVDLQYMISNIELNFRD